MNGSWFALLVVALLACKDNVPGPTVVASGPPSAPASGAEPSFQPRCDPSSAPRPDRDRGPMCWVPPGAFTMGVPVEADRPADGPARAVRISRGFDIDQYEVTVEQFARFLRESDHAPCEKRNHYCFGGYPTDPIVVENGSATAKPGLERLPIVITEFAGADAYCKWAGKRLPTEAEWEFAARHDPKTGVDRVYPWGDDYRPGVTNHFAALEPARGKYAVVGSFKDDRAAIGAYDMGGNASEWVADCFTLDFSCGKPCSDPYRNGRCEQVCTEGDTHTCEPARQTRGGSVADQQNALASKRRISTPASGASGVRCVFQR